MVDSVKSHIDLMIDKLKENFAFDEVIIFGSYAYGEPTDESDLDVCIIFSNEVEINKRNILKQIRKVISPIMEYPIDILIYNKDEFYTRANFVTTLEHKISEEGVRVFG